MTDPPDDTAAANPERSTAAGEAMTPEAVRRYVRGHYAFGLPAGSIRAMLALATIGGISRTSPYLK